MSLGSNTLIESIRLPVETSRERACGPRRAAIAGLSCCGLLLSSVLLSQEPPEELATFGDDSLYKHVAVLSEVLGLADRAYVDELEPGQMLEGALEGLIDALDPFSLLVPADRIELYERVRQVGDRHSGLTVVKQRGVAYALAVAPGGPAAEAGLKTGDIVTRIEGVSTRELPLLDVLARLAGDPGSTLRLEAFSGGNRSEVELELAEYEPRGMVLELRDGIAVLAPGRFGPGAAAAVAAELASVDGDHLLLDLRGIGGGDEAAAYAVAGLFADGELGALMARGEVLEVFSSDRPLSWHGRRPVVLVDRGTQGAAELLATILRQKIGAELVGTVSFGHSGRQRLFTLANGDRLLMTDAFYSGPDLEPLQQALVPDVPVAAGLLDSDEAKDEVLERAIEVLLSAESDAGEDVSRLSPTPSYGAPGSQPSGGRG